MSFPFSNPNSPQTRVANPPIIAQIDPPLSGPAMLQYPIGTMWVNTVSNVVFMLTSVANGQAFWQQTIAGAPGVFTDLVVTPGPIDLTGTTHITGDNDVAEVIRLREDGGTSASIVLESLQGTASDSIKLQSTSGGIVINTNGAAGDIDISSDLGRVTIGAGENIADAIQLEVGGGALSTILLTNTAGTDASSILLNSDDGGIRVVTNAASKDIGLVSTLGSVNIVGNEDAADVVFITTNGGTAATMALQNLSGTNTAAVPATAAVHILADLGGVGINAGLDFNIVGDTTSNIEVTTGDLNLTTTTGQLVVTSAGGIDLNITGSIELDATDDSHFTVTGALKNLLLSSVGGSVLIDANEAAVDAIDINASAGGIEIDSVDASHFKVTGAAKDLALQSVLGSVNVLASEVAADAIVISATGASAGIQIAPAATVASVAIANVIPTVARTVTVSGGAVGSAVADTLNLGTGVTTFAGATKVVNIATGNNTLGASTVNIATGTTASGTKAVSIGNSTDALTAVSVFGVVGVNTIGSGASTIGNAAAGGAIALTTNTAVSIDAKTASHFTVTGAADLTLSSSAGSTVITGGEAVVDAVTITAGNAAGGLDLNAGSGGVTIDTTAAISLDSATASNFTVTGAADLTLRSTAGSVVASSALAAANAIQLNCSDVAGGVTIDLNGGQVTVNNGNIEVATATKGVILGSGTKVIDGAGSPNASVTAAKGSLYLATNGSGVNDRLYINTDGATAWTAIVTVA